VWFWSWITSAMLGNTSRSTRVSADHNFERISALPQWK